MSSTAGSGWLIREMYGRNLCVIAEAPDFQYRIESRDSENPASWEEIAGSILSTIQDHRWLFEWGVLGKLAGHDWLQCDACDELQLLPKAKGAPSQKPKCHMSVGCTGTYRRMPEIFEVTKPKRKRLTKAQKEAALLANEQLEDSINWGDDEPWEMSDGA